MSMLVFLFSPEIDITITMGEITVPFIYENDHILLDNNPIELDKEYIVGRASTPGKKTQHPVRANDNFILISSANEGVSRAHITLKVIKTEDGLKAKITDSSTNGTTVINTKFQNIPQ